MITGEQIRAARALARLNQAELAARAHLSLETIKRLEGIRGPVAANRRTLETLEEALRSAGVMFDPDGGVRMVQAAGGSVADATGTRPAEPLARLIYHSRMTEACRGDAEAALAAILEASRRNNPAAGVTGALLASDERFLQALEGPPDSVEAIFALIRSDGRHEDVSVLEHRVAGARHFPEWSLCCGRLLQAHPAVSAEPALRSGLRPEDLSPAGALGLLLVVREAVRARPSRDGEVPQTFTTR